MRATGLLEDTGSQRSEGPGTARPAVPQGLAKLPAKGFARSGRFPCAIPEPKDAALVSIASRLVVCFIALFAATAAPAMAAGTVQVGISGAGSVSATGISCAKAAGGGLSGDCSESYLNVRECIDSPIRPICRSCAAERLLCGGDLRDGVPVRLLDRGMCGPGRDVHDLDRR